MAGGGKSFFPVIFNEIPSGYNGKTKDKKMTQGIFKKYGTPAKPT
jgi:hypothetical protein